MLAGLLLYLFVAWVGWRLLDAWACDAGEGEVPSGNRLRRGDASGSAGHLKDTHTHYSSLRTGTGAQ